MMSAKSPTLPLTDAAAVERLPILVALARQFGLAPAEIAEPRANLSCAIDNGSTCVFHVDRAKGSPDVQTQEGVVIPFGVASVVGMGGTLASGNIYALIMYSCSHIGRDTAQILKPLALNLRVAVLPLEGRVFK